MMSTSKSYQIRGHKGCQVFSIMLGNKPSHLTWELFLLSSSFTHMFPHGLRRRRIQTLRLDPSSPNMHFCQCSDPMPRWPALAVKNNYSNFLLRTLKTNNSGTLSPAYSGFPTARVLTCQTPSPPCFENKQNIL